jgi:hypothetical protein
MRRRTMLTAGLAAGTAAAAGTPGLAGADQPAILELFTSQGCSSCPPADALLGELARRPDIIALAWHVDYWNYLGWRDPHASKDWTERQRVYARLLHDEVYTPALVVNGAAMVIGSDRRAVQAAMTATAPVPLRLSVRREADRLTIDLGGGGGAAAPVELLLVAYEPEITTRVRAGENGGRTLREYRVVRSARRLDPVSGTVALEAIALNQGVAVLAQDASGRVIGAAETRAAPGL